MNFEISVKSTAFWETGGNAEIKIINNGSTQTGWSFDIETVNFTVDNFWKLTKVGTGNKITVKPADWAPVLGGGLTYISGFGYQGKSSNLQIKSLTSGVTVAGSTSTDTSTSTSTTVLTTVLTTPSTSTTVVTTPTFPADRKVFGYFSEWSIYDRQFSVEKIPVHNLTHIVYAFMLPNPSQTDYEKLKSNYPFPPLPYRAPPTVPEAKLVYHDEWAGQGNHTKLQTLKNSNPHIKVLISVGGWTLSWTLSKIAANPTLRKTFIESTVDFVVQKQFDGVDIDWEFVGKQGVGYNYVDAQNDGANFITLIKEMRAYMDKVSPNKHLEITSAIGTNPDVIKNYLGTEPYLDYVLLMTYDYAGSWGDGGHQSALYNNSAGKLYMNDQWNAHRAVENTKALGYATNKICMGCPMYGRGWTKLQPDNLLTPIFGKSVGAPGVSYSGAAGEPGLTSWRHLRDAINSGAGLTRFYDEVAKATYCFNKATGEAWTYDDPVSATEKAKYVVNKGLGGMLFWELSDDTRDGKDNILDAVVKVFKNAPSTTTTTPTTTTPTTPTTTTSTTTTTTPTPIINTLTVTLKNSGTSDLTFKAGSTVSLNSDLVLTNNGTDLVIKADGSSLDFKINM